MTIDFTKPVQTRDGRKVRILCTDGPEQHFPVVGFVEGTSTPIAWTTCGYWRHGNDKAYQLDLVNVPPPKKKVKVEIRLSRNADGSLSADAIADGEDDAYWTDEGEDLASTTIEMEYQP